MLTLLEEYPYLYETHLHTSQGSACGGATGKAMAQACQEAGYTGIIVTDHNFGGNCAISKNLPWTDWVNGFCLGYEDAKEYGDQNDFDVFFGWEAGFHGTEFLIYGLDKEWLLAHPEYRNCSIEEQYKFVHESNGYVIHAHPFREESYIPEIRLFPDAVDAVEAINATHSNIKSISHNDPMYDTRAIEYAKKYKFPFSAGSDIHSTNLFGGGVAFKKRLNHIQEFIEIMKSDGDYVLTNGMYWYTKQGDIIE